MLKLMFLKNHAVYELRNTPFAFEIYTSRGHPMATTQIIIIYTSTFRQESNRLYEAVKLGLDSVNSDVAAALTQSENKLGNQYKVSSGSWSSTQARPSFTKASTAFSARALVHL